MRKPQTENKDGQLEIGRTETGRLETGRTEKGRLETGRMEKGRLETGRMERDRMGGTGKPKSVMRKGESVRKRTGRDGHWWMTVAPLYLFTLFFVALPLLYLLILSFLTRAQTWGVVNEFTLDNYVKIGKPVYLDTFKESFQLAVLTTVSTLLIGYPFGYFMARLSKRAKSLMMLLVVIPFWTSALMRMYGWIIIFRSKGLLDKVLMGLGLTSSPLKLLYSYPAVLVGMVYSLLPFMILSVYSSTDKMDWSLVEAARDLGASRWTAFWTVTVKLTLPGILSGIVLVFIPSMGLFFIADILGGGKVMLVGNLIQAQLQSGRDWPFAAALSVMLMLFTSVMIWIYRKVAGVRELEGLL